ncbi:MAG: GntR family transcriptional regulator [Oscillospiraceae bacterium]|nr:GntR family transcriptional regulator [Oscillospiraceae bacterium]
MVSFESFVQTDGAPIYLQIIRHIKQGIAAGTVSDGEEMPSRRVLSALLGVNPNTVQKAYRLLEEEGLITSHSGAKSYLSLTEEKVAAVRTELMEGVVRTLVGAVKGMGVSREEALSLLEKLWDEEVR